MGCQSETNGIALVSTLILSKWRRGNWMKHALKAIILAAIFLLVLVPLSIGCMTWSLALPQKLQAEKLWLGFFSTELLFSWFTGSFLFLFAFFFCFLIPLLGFAKWFDRPVRTKDWKRIAPMIRSPRFLWLLYAAVLVQQTTVAVAAFWYIPSGFRFTTLCCTVLTAAAMAVGLYLQLRNRWMLSRVRIHLHEASSAADVVSGEIIVVGDELDGYQNLDFQFRCIETPTLNVRPQNSAFDTNKKDAICYWTNSAVADTMAYDLSLRENSYPFRMELPSGLPIPGASNVRNGYPFVNWEISFEIPQRFGGNRFRFLLPSIPSNHLPSDERLETKVDIKTTLAAQGILMTVSNQPHRVCFERSKMSIFSYLWLLSVFSLLAVAAFWFQFDIVFQWMSIALLIAGLVFPALSNSVTVSQSEVVKLIRLGFIPMRWQYKLGDTAQVVVKRCRVPGEDSEIMKFDVWIENAGGSPSSVQVLSLPTHWLADSVASSIAKRVDLKLGRSEEP